MTHLFNVFGPEFDADPKLELNLDLEPDSDLQQDSNYKPYTTFPFSSFRIRAATVVKSGRVPVPTDLPYLVIFNFPIKLQM